jgi:polysaccharide pyruvyl transferase WcaK-like protein
MATRPPSVAIWGTFDVDNYGDHLFPRIARRELGARIPGITVDAYSPFGWQHPTRLDDRDGPPVLPLGERTARRLDDIAARYDAVLVGGGELLHLDDGLLTNFYAVDPHRLDHVRPSEWFLEALGPLRERRCPVLWHGLGLPFDFDEARALRVRTALAHRPDLTVRDAHSARRLRAAGVAARIGIVPDSALVVDRLFPPAELDRRIARLRAAGAFPRRPALVLQGCDLLVPSAAGIAASLRPVLRDGGVEPVLVETGRCRKDGEFADALGAALGGHVKRVPATADVADLVAVMAHADAVVGSSLHAAVTALAFRRPFVVLDLGAESKLDGFGRQTGSEKHVVADVRDLAGVLDAVRTQVPAEDRVARLQAEVDAHFDRLAERILASARSARRRRRRPS